MARRACARRPLDADQSAPADRGGLSRPPRSGDALAEGQWREIHSRAAFSAAAISSRLISLASSSRCCAAIRSPRAAAMLNHLCASIRSIAPFASDRAGKAQLEEACAASQRATAVCVSKLIDCVPHWPTVRSVVCTAIFGPPTKPSVNGERLTNRDQEVDEGFTQPDDLTQAAVKIELFGSGRVAGIAADFIFASPRGRKVARRQHATLACSGRRRKVLAGALAEQDFLRFLVLGEIERRVAPDLDRLGDRRPRQHRDRSSASRSGTRRCRCPGARSP